MTEDKNFIHIANKLEEYFDERAGLHSDGLQAVGWKSREAQYNRFRELLKVVDLSAPFSILDYGCGDGELIKLLNSYNLNYEYFGFDSSAQMLGKAQEAYADSKNCTFTNDINKLPVVDYTIASGVFSMKFNFSNEEWKDYMLEKVNQFNSLSRKGFAFNSLTIYSDPELMRDELYYADPLFWFDYCKRNISRHVSLLHDYPEYDFTIIVKKQV